MRHLVASWLCLTILSVAVAAAAQEAQEAEGAPTDVVVVASGGTEEVTEEAIIQARMAVVSAATAQQGRHRRVVRPEQDPGLAMRASACVDDACLTDVGYDAQAAFLFVINVERSENGHRVTALLVDVLAGQTIASAAFELPLDPMGFTQAAAAPLLPLVNAISVLGPTTGILRIDVDQVGAAIFIDGRRFGTSPLQPLTDAPPGSHTVRVSMDGFLDFEQEVEVSAGQETAVQATLEPAPPPEPAGPPAPPPVYRRWWFWTIIGAVAVGAGLGIGLGVGLNQEEPTGPGQEWGVPFPDYEPR